MRASYLIRVMHAILLFMWVPVPVLAAAAVAMERGGEVASISWALAGVAMLLSTLAGITALLWRVERELRADPDQPLLRPWLFASSHMACSWLAGALAFSLSEAQNLNEWWEVSAVIAASFAGATFVQAAAERILSKLLPGSIDRSASYRPPSDYQYTAPRSPHGFDRDRMRNTRGANAMPAPRPEPAAGEVLDTRPGGLEDLPPGGGFMDPRAED